MRYSLDGFKLYLEETGKRIRKSNAKQANQDTYLVDDSHSRRSDFNRFIFLLWQRLDELVSWILNKLPKKGKK